MSAHRKKTDTSRIVGYRWETALDFGSTLDGVLDKAKARGTITDYDTGRGRFIWMNGRPGKALRELRREVAKALSPYLPVVVR